MRRSFVFLNLEPKGNADLNPEGVVTDVPAVMVIYDHVVSADPSFKKYWLLHSIEEPQTGKSDFTVTRTKDGDSGKLYCSVLLPEMANVEKVGGPGKEFWVFGENYPNAATTRPDPCNERGAWRVEVTPKNQAKEDCFLNVIQVMDNECKELPVQRIDAEKVVGVEVADRIVIFNRASGQLNEDLSFTISSKNRKEYRILITDLESGLWKVCRNGKTLKTYEVSESAGTIYLTGTAGKYTLTRQ